MENVLIELRERKSGRHVEFINVASDDHVDINYAVNALIYKERILQPLIPNYDRENTVIDVFDEACALSAHVTNPNVVKV